MIAVMRTKILTRKTKVNQVITQTKPKKMRKILMVSLVNMQEIEEFIGMPNSLLQDNSLRKTTDIEEPFTAKNPKLSQVRQL
jgi:ribosomal protein S12